MIIIIFNIDIKWNNSYIKILNPIFIFFFYFFKNILMIDLNDFFFKFFYKVFDNN